MREEIFIHFVVSEVENIFDGVYHFGDVERVQFFLFNAFNVKFVVDFLLDVLTIGLEINKKTFFCLLDLLHIGNKLMNE